MYSHGLPPELLPLVILPFLAFLGGPDDDSDEEPQDEDSQLKWLRSLGDRDALFQIMDASRELTQGLYAAEALAELGDVRGLDHLIGTLDSPSTYLGHEAAQILKRLNHPRGLRALHEHRKDTAAAASPHRSTRPAATHSSLRRDQLHEDLKKRKTDELVAIWHEHDRSQWSDQAFDVMEAILIERLGQLPRTEGKDAAGHSQDVDEDVDPRILELWRQGDSDSLVRFFEDVSDVSLQLEAAEALADLGDEDALEVLIEALDDSDEKQAEKAAQMLDWLDLPRGNAALEERRIEFDTDALDLFVEPSLQPRRDRTGPQAPAASRDAWAAAQQKPFTSQLPRTPASPPTALQPVWQGQPTAAPASGAFAITGAVGGLLGLLAFNLGLYWLGMLPPLGREGGWLRTALVFYLPASLAAGAAGGSAGSRIASALGMRLGWETGEGDLLPVLGALTEGAVSALVVDVLLFLFMMS